MCTPLHFYHKVTLRASIPQNTLWETLLGGCQGKAGRGREHSGKETVTLLEKQVCTLQTGDDRNGICPFSRDIEQAQPPIKLLLLGTTPGTPQCLCWSRDFPTGLPGPHPRSLPWLSLPSFLALQQLTAMSPDLSSDSNWLTKDSGSRGFFWLKSSICCSLCPTGAKSSRNQRQNKLTTLWSYSSSLYRRPAKCQAFAGCCIPIMATPCNKRHCTLFTDEETKARRGCQTNMPG